MPRHTGFFYIDRMLKTGGIVGFRPAITDKQGFRIFWSLDSGWGEFEIRGCKAVLKVLFVNLTLKSLSLPLSAQYGKIAALHKGRALQCTVANGHSVERTVADHSGRGRYKNRVHRQTRKRTADSRHLPRGKTVVDMSTDLCEPDKCSVGGIPRR